MPKIIERQSKQRATIYTPAEDTNLRRAVPASWQRQDRAAWDALKGLWADWKIDAVAYQRKLRQERNPSDR